MDCRGGLSYPWRLRWLSICLKCRWPGFDPWVGKIPWRRKWQPTPVLLPGESHGGRSLVCYSPWGHKESDTTERLHFHFHEDLQDLLELSPQKRCPFHYRGLECKSRKSGNTWSNRHIWPWSTKQSRSKANSVLPREHTDHNKHPLQTTKRRLYTWTSPR